MNLQTAHLDTVQGDIEEHKETYILMRRKSIENTDVAMRQKRWQSFRLGRRAIQSDE